MLEGLLIPLTAGGIFCLIQLSYGIWGWVAPTTLIFYGLALLRLVPGAGNWKPVYLAYYFCMANLAALLGTLSYFRGRRFVTWRPERA